MTQLDRVRSIWTGFPGGPGVTTMYFLDTATAVESLHSFWSALAGRLPIDVDIQVENAGDTIEDTTGDLVGAWSAASVTSVAGTADDSYAAPAGCVIDWLTETIANHRRLRGRTFLVPFSSLNLSGDGTIDTTALGIIRDAASVFQAEQSASLVVWHRGSGSDGSNGLVTSSFVPDKIAVLRSRRD